MSEQSVAEPFLAKHKRRPTAKRDGIAAWLKDEIAWLESIERTENGNGALDAYRSTLREVETITSADTEAPVARACEWQPIESAPRDGTWILGWAQRDSSPYRISWGCNHDARLAWCTIFGSFHEGYITHWMPLPEPPLSDVVRDALAGREG